MTASNPAYAAASIQQIKFDCLAYVKEFSALPGGWVVDLSERPEMMAGQAGRTGPWLWRAAISERAAATVADFLTARFGRAIEREEPFGRGRFLLLYRREDQKHAG